MKQWGEADITALLLSGTPANYTYLYAVLLLCTWREGNCKRENELDRKKFTIMHAPSPFYQESVYLRDHHWNKTWISRFFFRYTVFLMELPPLNATTWIGRPQDDTSSWNSFAICGNGCTYTHTPCAGTQVGTQNTPVTWTSNDSKHK